MDSQPSFFQKLKQTIVFVQSSVEELHNLTDHEVRDVVLSNEHMSKVQDFVNDINETYTDAAETRNAVLNNPVTLNELEEKYVALEQRLKIFENRGDLKSYGYVRWAKSPPWGKDSYVPQQENIETKRSVEKPQQINNGYTPKSTKSKNRALRSTFKVSALKENSKKTVGQSPRTLFFPTDKTTSYAFQQPSRFTLLPHNVYRKPEEKLIHPFGKCVSAEDSDLHLNPSFGIIRNNVSANVSEDQVTVEFTPGMTTKRPAPSHNFKQMASIVLPPPPPPVPKYSSAEFYADNTTPEEPTFKPIVDSAKLLKSIKGLKGRTGSTTPEKPISLIDERLQYKFLRKNI